MCCECRNGRWNQIFHYRIAWTLIFAWTSAIHHILRSLCMLCCWESFLFILLFVVIICIVVINQKLAYTKNSSNGNSKQWQEGRKLISKMILCSYCFSAEVRKESLSWYTQRIHFMRAFNNKVCLCVSVHRYAEFDIFCCRCRFSCSRSAAAISSV